MKLFDFAEQFYYPDINAKLKPRTIHGYMQIMRANIIPQLGDKCLADITRKNCRALHLSLQKTPVLANRVQAVLSSVLALAVELDEIPANPAAGITHYRERHRERYLTPQEITRLVNALGVNDAGRFLYLLLLTGARPGELKTARWEWLMGDVIRLPDSKRGARNIYLPPAAVKLLEPRLAKGLLFPTMPNLRGAWAKTIQKAEIPNVRMYDLRHTFASAALASGVSLPVIGQLLGHKKAETTLRYAHLAPDVGLEAAAKAAERITQ